MEGSWNPEAIAAELHDGPVQVVSMVALQLEAMAKREEMSEEAAGKTEALAAQLRDSVADLRRIISELMDENRSSGDDRS